MLLITTLHDVGEAEARGRGRASEAKNMFEYIENKAMLM